MSISRFMPWIIIFLVVWMFANDVVLTPEATLLVFICLLLSDICLKLKAMTMAIMVSGGMGKKDRKHPDIIGKPQSDWVGRTGPE